MENADVLAENGPALVDELPNTLTTEDKQEGVHVLRISGGKGKSKGIGGPVNEVAYLPGHEKWAVLKLFLDENPRLIEASNARALSQLIKGHGKEWEQCLPDILHHYYDLDEEYDFDGPSEEDLYTGENGICPLCGQTVPKSQMPNHLAGSCPGN